jgi:hypothetical protein
MCRLKHAGAAAVGLLLAACAHIGPPPGGPPRFSPPILLSTYPDSVRVLPDFHGDVSFQFDEVVSEGSAPNFGYGNGSLEMLVMLSPDTAVPSVSWHRSRLSLHPKHGWQPNTVYRIELLPGVSDLQARPNITKKSSVITFATGGPVPTHFLSGRAVDWASARGSPLALIDAYHLPDSAGYRAMTDSSGRFHIGPLPAGAYLVEAVEDQDRNHRRNGREPWDTVRVAAARDSAGEIWMFERDTMPPHVQGIAREDSTGIALTLTEPIDPYQTIPADSVRVLALPDSGTVGPVGAKPKALDDSLQRLLVRRTAKEDSVARRDSLQRDSIAKVAAAHPPTAKARGAAPPPEDLPQQKRPALGMVLVVRTTGTIQFGKRYYVEVHGVRTAGGVSGIAKGTFEVPKAAAPADTTHVKADSLHPKAGTTPAKPGTSKPDTARAAADTARAHLDSIPKKTDSAASKRDSTHGPPH